MAVTGYANDGLLDAIAAGTFSWASETIGAALLLANAWVPDKGDANLAAIIIDGATEPLAASYARQTLTGQLVDPDGTHHRSHQVADQIEFGSLETGDDYDTCVIYLDGATDADRVLLITIDLDGTQSTDGNPVNVVPNATALWDLVCP